MVSSEGELRGVLPIPERIEWLSAVSDQCQFPEKSPLFPAIRVTCNLMSES